MQTVEVRLPQTALLNLQKSNIHKLLEVGADAALPCSHVLTELHLAGEACIRIPGVLEQHGVGELGADRQLLVDEQEIRHLREAEARGVVGADDLDVALNALQLRAEVLQRPSVTRLGR